MRKYIHLSKCPNSLQGLFDISNSLPKDFQFVTIGLGLSVKEQKKLFYEIIPILPKTFINSSPMLQAFLNGKTKDSSVRPGWIPKERWTEKWWVTWEKTSNESCSFSPLGAIYTAFNQVKNIRKSLKAAIDYNYNPYDEWFPLPSGEKRINFVDIDGDFQTQTFNGFKVVDGVVEVRLNETFTVLVNEKIDTRRIKQCSNCEEFFWAKRMNAKSCGEKQCVEKLGARKYHEKNKEESNRKKRKKYYEEKKIAFCEYCVYPLSTHGEADCKLNKRSKQ